MFDRWVEVGLLEVLEEEGIGCIVFSPLQEGLLSDRYLHGIPPDSREARLASCLRREDVTEDRVVKVGLLSEIAKARGQTMALMALAWVLRQRVDIGATTAARGLSRILVEYI